METQFENLIEIANGEPVEGTYPTVKELVASLNKKSY
jgi:hypothetical protein